LKAFASAEEIVYVDNLVVKGLEGGYVTVGDLTEAIYDAVHRGNAKDQDVRKFEVAFELLGVEGELCVGLSPQETEREERAMNRRS
jgi:hypothetical protein